MSNGDRIIHSSITPGKFILQDGGGMRSTEWGFDEGERHWLTHPNTLESSYPQRNQRDSAYSNMFVRDINPTQLECGLILITATYKGIKNPNNNKQRILPNADVQMMGIGILSNGTPMTLLAPIPKGICIREYVGIVKPTLNGVGNSTAQAFLPSPPSFSVTFIADPDAAPPPKNYKEGWVLDSRSWEDVAGIAYLVTERYGYYNTVG